MVSLQKSVRSCQRLSEITFCTLQRVRTGSDKKRALSDRKTLKTSFVRPVRVVRPVFHVLRFCLKNQLN
jgi:hypothetical protein